MKGLQEGLQARKKAGTVGKVNVVDTSQKNSQGSGTGTENVKYEYRRNVL